MLVHEGGARDFWRKKSSLEMINSIEAIRQDKAKEFTQISFLLLKRNSNANIIHACKVLDMHEESVGWLARILGQK